MKRVPHVHLRKRPDSPYYQLDWSDTTRHRESTGMVVRAKAEEAQHELQAKLTAEHFGYKLPAPQLVHTLGPSVEDYLTEVFPETVTTKHATNTRQRLRRLARDLGADLPLDNITTSRLRTWARARLLDPKRPGSAKTVTPTTVENGLRALRAFFRWARESDRMTKTPKVVIVRGRTHREGIVPAGTVQALLSCLDLADPVHRGLFLAVWTGMRPEDLSVLSWQHIDLQRGFIEIPSVKSGTRMRVPILPEVCSLLEPYQDGPVCQVRDCHATRRLTKRLCGQEIYLRMFRSTLGHHLQQTGTEILIAKAILGHAIDDVTWGYLQATPHLLSQALRRLPWAPPPEGVTKLKVVPVPSQATI